MDEQSRTAESPLQRQPLVELSRMTGKWAVRWAILGALLGVMTTCFIPGFAGSAVEYFFSRAVFGAMVGSLAGATGGVLKAWTQGTKGPAAWVLGGAIILTCSAAVAMLFWLVTIK